MCCEFPRIHADVRITGYWRISTHRHLLCERSLVDEADGRRTFVIILETGDEVMRVPLDYAIERHLRGSHFSAIGAFSDAEIAYFDWQSRRYAPIEMRAQVEVLSMIGDIATDGDTPKVHRLRHLRCRFDPQSGLALIDPSM